MPPPRVLSASQSHVLAVAIVIVVIIVVVAATVVIAPATTLAVSIVVPIVVIIIVTTIAVLTMALTVSIIVTTIAVLAMALTVSIVVPIVVVITTIVAIAAAFAVIVAATMTEVVAMFEVSSDRTLPDPDRMLLVLVALRKVAHGHLDLAFRVPALVVLGAHSPTGRCLGISAALRIRCAIVAATKFAVFPDDVAQRLEGIADRDTAIVVHITDGRRAVAGMESTPEDVQDIADGRSVTFTTRLATVADAGD